MQVWLPESRYTAGRPVANFFQQAIERVSALPGVASGERGEFCSVERMRERISILISGTARRPVRESNTQRSIQSTDANYFHTMRIPLEEGREFCAERSRCDRRRGDHQRSRSEHRYWPNEDPVGKQIQLHFRSRAGAVEPRRENRGSRRRHRWRRPRVGLGGKTPPLIYLPYFQAPSHLMCLVIRTAGKPEGLVPPVREAICRSTRTSRWPK